MGEPKDIETLNLLRRHLKGLLAGIEALINQQINKEAIGTEEKEKASKT